MTTSTDRRPDPGLIDEAVEVVQAARTRAPADFLLALAAVLGTLAVVLLVAAALTTGIVQEFLLNLGVEVIGAWLTVVLIDGLWKRLEAGASDSLDAMRRDLESRREAPLSDDERRAWQAFVDDYRTLMRPRSPFARIGGVPAYGKRIHDLELHGERTLARFPHAEG